MREGEAFLAAVLPPGAEDEVEVPLRAVPPAPGPGPGLELTVPELTGRQGEHLCARLREARADLLDVPVREVAEAVGRVARRFMDPAAPLRREALDRLPPSTGLSPEMCRTVLDGMARDWTAERLEALLETELENPSMLDGFISRGPGRGRARALAPPLSVHICSGTVPGVSATSLVRGLLAKGPLLVKPGRGDVVLPVLLLRALAEEAPVVARAGAVLYWPGGQEPWDALEATLLAQADRVVAYGDDATIRDLRARLPLTVPLRAYHHRMSIGIVGEAALGPARLQAAARSCARAVALFDQRGCVSPHVLYLEGEGRGEAFGEALAAELDTLHRELPPGAMGDLEASRLHQTRGVAELQAAADEGVRVWSGRSHGPWTVVLDPAAGVTPSCLNRVVRLVPVGDVLEVPQALVPRRRHLQTAGILGVDGTRLERLAEVLGRVGVLRITPMENVPFPPPWWHHDGQGPLRALLSFVDLEETEPA